MVNNELTLEDQKKYFDELYRPVSSTDKSMFLSEIIVKEMEAEGLDPLNKNDVYKFWASKGIKVNG